jgi:hypothetical protein
VATLVIAMLASCGVPQDDEPRVVPDGDVPFGLLETTTSTRLVTTTAS